ncbi:MAG: aminopeptidase [Chloroflexota bacterium]
MTQELDMAVRTVLRDCLRVEPGEEVLVICNPVTEEIGSLMRIEAEGDGAFATLAIISELDSNGAEPPTPVAAAMVAAQVVLAPTIQSLSHTSARHAATQAGVRIATLPGVTEEMLARLMNADMRKLRRRGSVLAAHMRRGEEVRITCAHGSDLRIELGDRTPIADAGELHSPGAFGNLPCGEAFVAPTTAEGTLIVDGSIAGVGKVETPVELTVRDGHLADATGPEGEALLELLTKHGEDGTNIAELGIGTNEEATLTGNILEDEKILGTAHVAFGASAAIGGAVQVPVHLDCVIVEPTVEIDGKEIVHAGELLI